MKFVFDFGGVLFRWRPLVLVQERLPHLATDDASAKQLVAQIFQGYGGDWGEFDRGTLDAATLVRRIAARTSLKPADVQAIVDAVPAELQPIDDSVRLLQRLRDADRRLFFLSNMPAPYADHLEREHAFVQWFHDGVFSARVNHVKPQPAIFELAARRFGVPPGELVFFDDHRPNVVAAREAGWNALLFRDAVRCEVELRRLGWWGG
jgi:putative hydrolase of the HAD superfamily